MMRILLFTLFLFVCLFPAQLFASHPRTLYIEFSYEEPELSNLELSGFRLYMSGKQICQIDSYFSQSFECEFQSGNGKFNFTLAPLFSDNSVGPHSAPYSVTISGGNSSIPVGPVQLMGVMTNITALLLENNEAKERW